MFNPAAVVTAAFGDHLAETYLQIFKAEKAHFADFLNKTARETLEQIGRSDAPYHNAEHTMMVTLVGQRIIQGKHKTSPILPEDWLHYVVALLLHDIGFTRGICAGDTFAEVVISETGDRVCPPRGGTDAFLAPYHVDRAKMYVRQRFAGTDFIDPERIAKAIEYTRFPVPDDPAYASLDSEPALVRAADLIGQTADPFYLRKLSALYHEFLETGVAQMLGITSSMDMVEQFPTFFRDQVEPLIGPALEYLKQTPEGKEWIARLNSRVSEAAQNECRLGPFPGEPNT